MPVLVVLVVLGLSAPLPKPDRNLGQILGWAWLAWLLVRRD